MRRIYAVADVGKLHGHFVHIQVGRITITVKEGVTQQVAFRFVRTCFDIQLAKQQVRFIERVTYDLRSVISVPASEFAGIKHCYHLIVIYCCIMKTVFHHFSIE
jgi:hypothetical protein